MIATDVSRTIRIHWWPTCAVVIMLFSILIVSCIAERHDVSIPPRTHTRGSVQQLLEKTIDSYAESDKGVREFRNQIKVLTLTIVVALLGFAFTKGQASNRGVFGIGVFGVCAVMYLFDTLQYNEMGKFERYNRRLTDDLISFETLDSSAVDSVLKVIYGGPPRTWPTDKLRDVVTFRGLDVAWFGLPAAVGVWLGWRTAGEWLGVILAPFARWVPRKWKPKDPNADTRGRQK